MRRISFTPTFPGSLLLVCVLAFWGCGGGSGGGGGNPVTITISPTTATVNPAASQTFTATVGSTTNTTVTWRVQEAAGGTVTQQGVYTAPNTAGTYHVVAASQADTTKTAAATVTVPLVVTVAPATVTQTLRDTRTFVATVLGSANSAVTWRIQEGATGGTITAGGVYTAPGAPGTFHIIATSQADTAKSGTATVTVQAGSASGSIQ